MLLPMPDRDPKAMHVVSSANRRGERRQVEGYFWITGGEKRQGWVAVMASKIPAIT
jgi:hypothetical protein